LRFGGSAPGTNPLRGCRARSSAHALPFVSRDRIKPPMNKLTQTVIPKTDHIRIGSVFRRERSILHFFSLGRLLLWPRLLGGNHPSDRHLEYMKRCGQNNKSLLG